jgi:hypothetical protein
VIKVEIVVPIITAVISGGSAAIAAIIVASIQHKKTVALLEYRLLELEKKVDKHNNIIERTYELEKQSAVIQNDIKVANHRIDDLEKKG